MPRRKIIFKIDESFKPAQKGVEAFKKYAKENQKKSKRAKKA